MPYTDYLPKIAHVQVHETTHVIIDVHAHETACIHRPTHESRIAWLE